MTRPKLWLKPKKSEPFFPRPNFLKPILFSWDQIFWNWYPPKNGKSFKTETFDYLSFKNLLKWERKIATLSGSGKFRLDTFIAFTVPLANVEVHIYLPLSTLVSNLLLQLWKVLTTSECLRLEFIYQWLCASYSIGLLWLFFWKDSLKGLYWQWPLPADQWAGRHGGRKKELRGAWRERPEQQQRGGVEDRAEGGVEEHRAQAHQAQSPLPLHEPIGQRGQERSENQSWPNSGVSE